MGNKYLYYGVVTILISVVIGILLFIIYPLLTETGGLHTEIRIMVRVFIVCSIILVFAILRLYNAIFGNTKMVIKLAQSMINLYRAIPGLKNSLTKLESDINKNTTQLKEMGKILKAKK